MNMKKLFTLTLASALALGGLGFAPDAYANPVRRRVPINVSGEEMGSLIFAQLIFKVEETGDISGLKDEYVQLFNDALREAGYKVPTTTKSVFKKEELPETDFILAGAIVGFDCTHLEGTTCGLAVEWELLHRSSDQVVYRFQARSEETELRNAKASQGAKSLLLGSLRSLLARPRFVEALKGEVSAPDAVAYETATLKACSDPAPKMPGETEKALAATVVVKTNDGVGSGAFISPDGYFLTAAHVATQNELKVTMRNGATLPAEVVRIDTKADVALVRLKDRSKVTPCLGLGETTPATGEDIYVLGAPAGEELSFSVSRGIVSGMRTIPATAVALCSPKTASSTRLPASKSRAKRWKDSALAFPVPQLWRRSGSTWAAKRARSSPR
jgi:serine protease Do